MANHLEPKLVKDQPLFDVLSLYISKNVMVKTRAGKSAGILSIFTADNGNQGWMIGSFDDKGWMIFSAEDVTKATALPLADTLDIHLSW